MTSILVVEDNPDLAFGLRTTLEIEGYEVAVAADGHEGLERARSADHDLVILDLMLPGMDGYRVLRALRDEGSTVPVLILTARGEEADKVLGFNSGADDYVTKPFGLSELLARIKALLRRASPDANAGRRPSGALETIGREVTVNLASRTVHRDGKEIYLTPKEFELLEALIKRRGAVASRLDLLREVWDYSAAVMTRTVDMHVAELRRKIEANPSQPQHILTVRKVGYRLEA